MSVKNLTSYSSIFDDEIIIEILDITLRANKNFNYAIGILNNWKNRYVKTVGEAKQYFKNNKNPQHSNAKKVIKEPSPLWNNNDYVIPEEDCKPVTCEQQNIIKQRLNRLAEMREESAKKDNKIS